MEKIYCGIDKVPKGRKLGTLKECAESKQVRYYGLKQVDKKLLDQIRKGKKGKISRDKLIVARLGLLGKIKRLNRELEDKKITAQDKKNKQKELEKAKIDLAD